MLNKLKKYFNVFTYSPVASVGISNRKNEKVKWVHLLFTLAIAVILNPFFAAVFACLLGIAKGGGKKYINALIITCVIFVSLVNSSKMPENDLQFYVGYFLDASNMDFIPYLYRLAYYSSGAASDFIKEPVYGSFSFLMYHVTGGQPRVFLFVYSCLFYLILSVALYKFCVALHLSRVATAFCLALLFFTPYIFTMSEQIIRQSFATAIVFYVYTNRFFYGKNSFLWIILASLIHSSSLLFLIFVFVPFLVQRITRRNISIYLLIIIIVIFYQYFASNMMNLTGESYALGRAADVTAEDKERITVLHLIVSTIITFLPLYCIQKKKSDVYGMNHISHIFLFILIFIYVNIDNGVMASRINFYVWDYFPFALAIVLCLYKEFQSGIFFLLLSAALIIMFVVYLHVGAWKYLCADDILTNTLFGYFNYQIHL